MPRPGAKSGMIRRFQIGSGTLLLLFLPACYVHRLPTPIAHITRARLPSFKHVFVVVEENQGYANVIGNTQDMPYLNRLAARYGLATNYYANAHPSINNYFFLTAGRMGTFAPWIRDLADVFPFDVGGENVVSILSENGKSWKAYAESIPGRAYIGDDHGLYVKRHNPFAYFDTVRGKASQRRNIVPFGDLARDLRDHRLPDYGFIVPNIYGDGYNDPEIRTSMVG
jgi:phospholipase C